MSQKTSPTNCAAASWSTLTYRLRCKSSSRAPAARRAEHGFRQERYKRVGLTWRQTSTLRPRAGHAVARVLSIGRVGITSENAIRLIEMNRGTAMLAASRGDAWLSWAAFFYRVIEAQSNSQSTPYSSTS